MEVRVGYNHFFQRINTAIGRTAYWLFFTFFMLNSTANFGSDDFKLFYNGYCINIVIDKKDYDDSNNGYLVCQFCRSMTADQLLVDKYCEKPICISCYNQFLRNNFDEVDKACPWCSDPWIGNAEDDLIVYKNRLRGMDNIKLNCEDCNLSNLTLQDYLHQHLEHNSKTSSCSENKELAQRHYEMVAKIKEKVKEKAVSEMTAPSDVPEDITEELFNN